MVRVWAVVTMSEQTLNQLLVEMDGDGGGRHRNCCRNRLACKIRLCLPGRFDRQVTVSDIRGHELILKVHMRKVPLAENVDLEGARGTPGFSGADLANLVGLRCSRLARVYAQ